jgi:hypothetical protein
MAITAKINMENEWATETLAEWSRKHSFPFSIEPSGEKKLVTISDLETTDVTNLINFLAAGKMITTVICDA